MKKVKNWLNIADEYDGVSYSDAIKVLLMFAIIFSVQIFLIPQSSVNH